MMANVVGAVHNPIPVLMISSGHVRSQYGESDSRTRMLTRTRRDEKQADERHSRRPIRGRYQR